MANKEAMGVANSKATATMINPQEVDTEIIRKVDKEEVVAIIRYNLKD